MSRLASTPSPPSPRRISRRRRAIVTLGFGLLLALIAFAASAIIPGSHASAGTRARAVAAVDDPARGTDRVLEHHVVDSKISARDYGVLDSAYNEGVTAQGELISQDPLVTQSQFARPIAEYTRYAEVWAVRLGAASTRLTAALRSGDRGLARARWDTAFADYLHLGAVYEFLPGTLDNRLAEVPPSTGTRNFPGLHRIEKGLWTGQGVRSLVPVAVGVQRATIDLRRVLPSLAVGTLAYTLRAHEILEDAQRDLMSGLAVPWSGEGVLGTKAGLVATREVVATLAPMLAGRDNALGSVDYWLGRLGVALRSARRASGAYPSLSELSQPELERIDGTLAGTLGALSQIPSALDTYQPSIPSLPRSAKTR